ncbi:MAG: hypothetical protein U0271_31240 [Polyangiaceae bacterium]
MFSTRLFAVSSFAVLGSLLAFTVACGDSGTGGGGGGNVGGSDDCRGGVIVNGVCEGKCTPDQCLEGNTCVGNRCVLLCDSQADCFQDGSQSCAAAVEDDTGSNINVCQPSGKSGGIGVPCPSGSECGDWYQCPDGGTCHASDCGGDLTACAADTAACEGVDNCTIGKCPDGSACRTDCGTACYPWLDCQTAGLADADSYCINRDCQSDDDCIDGYFCAIVRDPHEVCDSNPQKGDSQFCGTTSEGCLAVDGTGHTTDGSTRFEGSLCMLRQSCMKRGQAAPCATDLDCSRIDAQKCATYAGETRCSRLCANDDDCHPDDTCDTAQGACVPRFSAWVTATGGFCEPCLSDADCGDASSTKACVDISGGARACFDEAFPDTCTTDANCPTAPGGKHGSCLDERFGLAPGDSVYHRCYLPLDVNSNKTECW